jgi:thymidylate synthase ThyX
MTQITAKIIAHSITEDGKEIITWELEYPRFIHAEFMTHRLFSRNAASSRAIQAPT